MIIRSLLRSSRLVPLHHPHSIHPIPRKPFSFPLTRSAPYSTTIDSKITEIQDLYATAKDEFEIASEETSKKTVYAADDRAAAQEEFAKLKAAFEKAVREEGGEEIRSRVGGRVRELERAVEAMEEMVLEE